jgi:hypothetical protein
MWLSSTDATGEKPWFSRVRPGDPPEQTGGTGKILPRGGRILLVASHRALAGSRRLTSCLSLLKLVLKFSPAAPITWLSQDTAVGSRKGPTGKR